MKDSTPTAKQSTTQSHSDIPPPEAWDAIAEGYDLHVADGEKEVALTGLRLAQLDAGDYFLDVAAGTGGLALPAARLGARVVATDWSPKMIERFEERAREEGLSTAVGYVMGCHSLDFEDNSFDVTGSQFGVMLVPEQSKALREMARVTKPGGRVLVTAYGEPDEFEALQWFIGALKEANPEFPGPPDEETLEFQLADPDVFAERLRDAGLRDVEVHTSYRECIRVSNGKELLDWLLSSNPIPSMLMADLNESRKTTLCSLLDARVKRNATSDGAAELTAALRIGIGTK